MAQSGAAGGHCAPLAAPFRLGFSFRTRDCLPEAGETKITFRRGWAMGAVTRGAFRIESSGKSYSGFVPDQFTRLVLRLHDHQRTAWGFLQHGRVHGPANG